MAKKRIMKAFNPLTWKPIARVVDFGDATIARRLYKKFKYLI
jgi:hypothetical protein